MDDIIMVMTIGLFLEAAQFAFLYIFFHPFSKYSFIFGLPNRGLSLFALMQASSMFFLSLDSSVVLLGLHLPLSNYLALTKQILLFPL